MMEDQETIYVLFSSFSFVLPFLCAQLLKFPKFFRAKQLPPAGAFMHDDCSVPKTINMVPSCGAEFNF